MSWPSRDTGSSMESGDFGDAHARPTDPSSLVAHTPKGPVLGPAHIERNLRLLSVPFENLPQMPSWSRALSTRSTKWQKAQIAQLLASVSLRIGRVLTPEEADALAQHRSNWCRKMCYITPVYLGTTLAFAWRGRKTFRFPFYTPNAATFSPTYFPSRAIPAFTGAAASYAWHSLRLGAYGILSIVCVSTLMTSWADTSYFVHFLQDERLRELRQIIPAKAREQPRYPQQPSPHPEAVRSSDAAPAQPHGAGYAGVGAFRTGPGQQPQPPQWSQGAPESTEDALGTDGSLFDDASPVAPSHQAQAGSASAPADQGSAWDRLRQRAQAEQSNHAGQQPQTGPSRASVGQPGTEQYTYSRSEEEKAYAKEQAQKEFDAMLERERRGVGESGGQH